MAFEARGNNKAEGNNDKLNVDFDALNKYVVQTAGLEQEETVIGIISGVVDLGEQPQEDAMVEWKGTPDEEREEVASRPETYFEDIGEKRYRRFPVKPVQCVALTVDLPDVIVDKAQFFTDGEVNNPAPLRLCMNGTFWRKNLKVMDLGRLFQLTLRKNDKTHDQWSFLPNNTLYKMAVGAKIISQGEPFTPERIPELLGKALLFKVRIFFNDAGYYTERISYAAGLMKGQSIPEYDTDLLFSVGFMSDNDDQSIKFLTNPMINRMKMSSEWEDSEVKKQIERIKGWTKSEDGEEEKKTPLDNVPPSSPMGSDFPDPIPDDDIPF